MIEPAKTLDDETDASTGARQDGSREQLRSHGKSTAGRLTTAQNDALDFAQAFRSMVDARSLLAVADALIDPRERREVRADALAQLHLVERFIAEICNRKRR